MKKIPTNILLSQPARDALDRLSERRKTNLSRTIEDLILKEQRANENIAELKSILASTRQSERNLLKVLGILNSLFQGFPTLSAASYRDPSTDPHPVFVGADRAEKNRIRKAMVEMNLQRQAKDRDDNFNILGESQDE